MSNEADERAGGQQLNRVLEVLGTIVTPVSVLGGALFYFGWVRLSALYSHFGVDQAVLRFSTQDYLLKSIGVLFRLVILVLAAAAVAALLLSALKGAQGWLERHPRRRWSTLVFVALGLAIVSLSLLGLVGRFPPLSSAIFLGVGSFVLYYSTKVATIHEDTRSTRGVAIITAFAVITSLYWTSAILAQRSGEEAATYIANNPTSRPGVIVYSQHPLYLEGPGISQVQLSGPAGAKNYKYTGYRVLIYSNERLVLIPPHKSPGNRTATVVLD
ncbi:MAG: hypothetical protein LC775_11495, partial [Acidobacteria bacterium]|nr:hypothetical protein [Acidobacteriota bacterium]